MKFKKSIIDYSKLNNLKLHEQAVVVGKDMTGNKNFPSPSPTITDFTNITSQFAQAITDAKSGDRNALAKRNALRTVVLEGLKLIGSYVNTTANGNVEMLVSSGFTLSKDREPSQLNTPAIAKLLQGKIPGSIVLHTANTKGAKSFVFEVGTNPANGKSDWQSFPDSRSKYEFTNLTEGKKYWFRVVAIGTNNQIAYSEPMACYVMQHVFNEA